MKPDTDVALARTGTPAALELELPAPEAPPTPVGETPVPVPAPAAPTAPERLVSMDAYRGLVMVLMVSAGLGITRVVRTFEQTPELAHLKTPLWERLAFHTDHAEWVGCSLWDLIQPSFMFMVGVSLPFSIASRKAKGHPFRRMLLHAVARSAVLVLLGVFLMSNGSRGTNWTFDNVLTQIGLGYTFLFLVAWLRPRWQLVTAAAVLVVTWLMFVAFPAPAADVPSAALGLPENWQRLEGVAAHFEKHTNVAARADRWFLNLFPRADGKPFERNGGGYATLNFLPSLATMIFGLLAGELIRSRLRGGTKFAALLGAGLAGLAIGWALGWLGVCPVVKRIWTPSWAIYSAGWAFVLLGVFYVVIDVAKFRLWALPLVVVGMNSIAVYCMSMLLKPWVRESLKRHAGQDVYNVFGGAWAPMVETSVFLLFCWAACWWMYRKKVFVRI
jgi:predicted acyltransferase